MELCFTYSPYADRLIKIRQILEQLYKSVTENSLQSFNGLFARMQYANSEAKLASAIQMQSNKLRILCNQIAHEEVKEAKPEDFYNALNVVDTLLKSFCREYSNERLSAFLADKPTLGFTFSKDTAKHSFHCVLNSWKTDPSQIELEVVLEDGSFASIRLNNEGKPEEHNGRLWTQLSKSLWKYASLHCMELSEINGKQACYMSNPKTLIVLEPDFLIDSSALASCFGSSLGDPMLFLLSHLFNDPSTEAKLQGSMVNSMFDELVFNSQADYLELFKQGLSALPIAMVSLGKESATNIYNRIAKEHLPQLKSFVSNLEDSEILLEPSFICPQYGLQGRLDLLAKKGDKYNIVELKSGKAHHTEIWTAHQMQAIAYNMIVRSAYGSGRINNAAILYSVSPENPLRNVVNYTVLEQDLLMCRNRIIGMLHKLSDNPTSILSWLKNCSITTNNPIARSLYERYKALLASLSDYEEEWFLAQVQRIVRELWFVKTGDNGSKSESSYGHNALWQMGIAEKLAAYKIITSLKPLSQDKNHICFHIPHTDAIADFREGDIVVLYQQDKPITAQEILRGVLQSMGESSLEVTIRGGLKNNQRFAENSLWAIEHDILETSLYAPLGSLTHFLGSNSAKRNLLLGLAKAQTQLSNATTTADDLAAILNRMHAAHELFIVQGPPGTGKTSGLLSRYIRQIYQQTDKNLLVLSFTNRAVDEICLCLAANEVPFLRAGSSSVIQDRLLSHVISGKRFEQIEEIIKQNRIWVATVQSANAWYLDILKITKFHEIIVDEASQIVESGILGIISKAPKLILIGDQNQLPPIVVQSPQPFHFSHSTLQQLFYGSFNQSLMERLHKVYTAKSQIDSLAMLKLHYRMHESIAKLVSDNYKNQLISATPEQTEPLSSNPLLPGFLSHRLIWISCPPSEILHYDPLQVKLINALVKKLIQAKEISDPNMQLGIVAPFRAMIHALRKELNLPEITIDTVERFQGSQRDNIILCLPLKHQSNLQQVQSLSDDESIDRKLNVALSRAKKRIIIIANLELCQSSRHYARIFSEITLSGVVLDSALASSQIQL